MADIREQRGVKFGSQQLLIETAPGSGLFTAPCGVTGLTRNITTNTNDVNLPGCDDDPDAPLWLGIDAVSKRMTLSFTGTLMVEALSTWDDWAMSGGGSGGGSGDDASSEGFRRIRWYRNLTAPNAGYWEGYALLTEYNEESSDRGRYTNSGTIIFDGKPEWTKIATP